MSGWGDDPFPSARSVEPAPEVVDHGDVDTPEAVQEPANEQAPKLLAGLRNGAWLDRQAFPPLAYQGLPAGLGEPHPLRAGVDQAAADQGLSDRAADRPASDHRIGGVGELPQGGPLGGGQLRWPQVGRVTGIAGGGRVEWDWGAPGAQGAELDLGPGPAPAWGRPR